MNASIRIRTDDFLIHTDDGKALFLTDGLHVALSILGDRMTDGAGARERDIRGKAIDLLADFCHTISRSRGWWNDPITGATLLGVRNFGEMLALVHSEISETYEASSAPADAIDEKTEHSHIAVELSDILIRLFDLIFAERINVRPHIQPWPSITETLKLDCTLDNFCVEMHAAVTTMLEAHRKGKRDEIGSGAVLLIDHVFEAAAFCKLDLASAFLAKCRYNLGREDHSLEARRAAGGKAY